MILLLLFAAPMFSLQTKAKAIYTRSAKINAAVELILDKCTIEGMSKEQKLKAVYLYLVYNMKYTHGHKSVKIHVKKKHLKMVKAQTKELKKAKRVKFSSKFKHRYRNVLTMSGTCFDMSAVFCIIANHLGYKAGLCSGSYISSGGGSCEHWWNYVVVEGEKRYFDVQAANAMKRSKYKYFNKKKNSRIWRKHHSG